MQMQQLAVLFCPSLVSVQSSSCVLIGVKLTHLTGKEMNHAHYESNTLYATRLSNSSVQIYTEELEHVGGAFASEMS